MAADGLQYGLNDPDPSVRLQATLAVGTRPDARYVEVLVSQCADEPDFYVREMLTWALVRHSPEVTVPLLLGEVQVGGAQARSQALHTLSKIGDPRGWSAITSELLQDPDDDVARSAWRAAVALVPMERKAGLATTLTTQLGRGDRDVQLSLGRAFAGLGEAAVGAALAAAATQSNENVRVHAIATQRVVSDPDEGFDASVFEAKRMLALMEAPVDVGGEPTTDPFPEFNTDQD
ncbi:HEAT repeat protein [Nakamurella sp. UYEF19]|uniref:HEAT repeat domain-containing protein n=1 Tax=Nakamurella sp. UYEF19 TaxID=1756392 RepID=UPI003390EEDA